jgi:hypothetical protein
MSMRDGDGWWVSAGLRRGPSVSLVGVYGVVVARELGTGRDGWTPLVSVVSPLDVSDRGKKVFWSADNWHTCLMAWPRMS